MQRAGIAFCFLRLFQRGFLRAAAVSLGRCSRYLASQGVRTARAGRPATLA